MSRQFFVARWPQVNFLTNWKLRTNEWRRAIRGQGRTIQLNGNDDTAILLLFLMMVVATIRFQGDKISWENNEEVQGDKVFRDFSPTID